jgi:hypothetical protein
VQILDAPPASSFQLEYKTGVVRIWKRSKNIGEFDNRIMIIERSK